MKMTLVWFTVATTIIMGLSYFANIPYVYTITVLSILVFAGHLVTIDDDMKGGWSNPENSTSIWRSSKFELLVKFLVVVLMLIIILVFPGAKEF